MRNKGREEALKRKVQETKVRKESGEKMLAPELDAEDNDDNKEVATVSRVGESLLSILFLFQFSF